MQFERQTLVCPGKLWVQIPKGRGSFEGMVSGLSQLLAAPSEPARSQITPGNLVIKPYRMVQKNEATMFDCSYLQNV